MSDLYQIQPLYDLVDAYRRATGVTDATLGTRLFNDGKKVAALRAGGTLTLKSAEAAVKWFAAHWPKDAVWPDDIPRPSEKSSPIAAAPVRPSEIESRP